MPSEISAYRVAVVVAVFNEEKHLPHLLSALSKQSHQPQEIIIVDDGSSDRTNAILRDSALQNSRLRIFHQNNRGPAAARNLGWKGSLSEICVFTDGDCVPDPDWLEKLIVPFENPNVGASAGTYRTMNPENILARFIGLEIAWRHSRIGKTVDAHGSYNLAVRKQVLEETGGFKEMYKKPSGEDWDLTYRISKKHKIAFVRDAVVGHYHPESFTAYMKNQCRRGYDRMLVYRDHPEKRSGDGYTGNSDKYQILAAGLFTVSSALLPSFIPGASLIQGLSFFVLLICSLASFPYIVTRDPATAFVGACVSFVRAFFWFFGAAVGFFKFYFQQADDDA